MSSSRIIRHLFANSHKCSLLTFETRRLVRDQSSHSSAVVTLDDDQQSKTNPLEPFEPLDDTKKNFLNELNLPIKTSFNLAAYVNRSKALQELLKLNVSLFDIEQKNRKAAQFYVTLDFDRDCVNHIKFLVDNGVKEKNLGRFISEYPLIFKEDLEELGDRIEYLKKKKFSDKQIARALNKSSFILSHATKTIDHKLGQLQIKFKLSAELVRTIVIEFPPIISIEDDQLKLFDFTMSAEFGFTLKEIQAILGKQPNILGMDRETLVERIDFAHNTMALSHSTLAKFPKLITGPHIEICQRFRYLEKLKRNQFDPKKPLYVPPSAMYNISDEEFCEKYAKTNIVDYKLFIKSR